jgi:hypothetical protein
MQTVKVWLRLHLAVQFNYGELQDGAMGYRL